MTRKSPRALSLGVAALVAAGELAGRITLYRDTGERYCLTAPFGHGRYKQRWKQPVEYTQEVDWINKDQPGREYFKMKPGRHTVQPRQDDRPAAPSGAPLGVESVGNTYTVNSLGFRGPEFQPVKPDPTGLRIICIGASSTFGAEMPDGRTWPERLEVYLNQSGGRRTEVINAAMGAYTSAQYVPLVREELLGYQPDIVIMCEGYNELYMNGLQANFVERPIGKLILGLHKLLYYRLSMLYTLATEKLSLMVHQNATPVFIWRDDADKNFRQRIRDLIRACRERGVRVVVVRQLLHTTPRVFADDGLSLEEIKALEAAGPPETAAARADPTMIFGVNRLLRSLRQLCDAEQVPWIDVRQEFLQATADRPEPLFYDAVHLTAPANDLLARLLATRLLAVGR